MSLKSDVLPWWAFSGRAAPSPPLPQIIRGALWSVRLNVPFGPRPGQDDNIFAADYLESYSVDDRQRGYAALVERHYTDLPMGPLVDAGYHGQFPATDFRQNPDAFLSVLTEAQDHNFFVTLFGGVDGWSTAQMEQAFGAIFRRPDWQAAVKRFVPYGWEPGGYNITNAMWLERLAWGASVFPKAELCLHMVADQDAPAGGDDDQHGGPDGGPLTNAQAWANLMPYLDRWLVQNNAFASPDAIAPNGQTNFQNFQDQFNVGVSGSLAQRFRLGYADWPTKARSGKPLLITAGEFSSYWEYWNNRPEAEAQAWGRAALAAGADGSFDGC